MGFIPMKFSFDNTPTSEADSGFALHLAPSTGTILFFKTGKFPDTFADRDGFNVRNLVQYIKIGHRARSGLLFEESCRRGSASAVVHRHSICVKGYTIGSNRTTDDRTCALSRTSSSNSLLWGCLQDSLLGKFKAEGCHMVRQTSLFVEDFGQRFEYACLVLSA